MTTADGFFGGRPFLTGRPARNSRGRPKVVLNPWRLYRRKLRLERHALEEAQLLRRRHGPGALHAAHQKLLRPDLTPWGRKVMRRAIQLLRWTV
jgi:hypothetical protein